MSDLQLTNAGQCPSVYDVARYTISPSVIVVVQSEGGGGGRG